jgi:hypothetical protein
MKLVEITELAQGKGLKMFDDSELVVAINCSGQAKAVISLSSLFSGALCSLLCFVLLPTTAAGKPRR